MPGSPTNLDTSRARPSALAVSANGLVWTFFSCLSFSSSLSLGDGPKETEILSQKAGKPYITNQQPTIDFGFTFTDMYKKVYIGCEDLKDETILIKGIQNPFLYRFLKPSPVYKSHNLNGTINKLCTFYGHTSCLNILTAIV